MQGSERHMEHALAAVDAERDRVVARIRSKMVLKGDEYCQDCGDPIDVARRMALPSATRCVECQDAHERQRR